MESNIPQSTQIFISNALSVGFELVSLSSVRIAYTQRIWYRFRLKPLKGSVIDSLFNLPHYPSSLLSLELFWRVPLEWMIGLLCALLPVVIMFPPSALNIVPTKYPETFMRNISTFNVSMFSGDPRLEAVLRSEALFFLDADLVYRYVQSCLD